jgi:Family of unknown function (DUF6064)
MNPPFTIEQFLGVFVAYNAAIWPAQIVAYILGIVAVSALWMERSIVTGLILSILAVLWAWNGIGYHFLFFAQINPAAKLFAGLFMLQAFLFAVSGVVANAVHFEPDRSLRSIAGATFIIYAMFVYPILGLWAGHGLMKGPMFGVAPCPTIIFTIGMLLLARGPWVIWLSIIPFLWSLVGLAAAAQLGIPEDLGLAVAGLVLVAVLAAERLRSRVDDGTARPRPGSATG